MSKLGFLLELSIRELKRSVKINVLVILSLALGMYLPILSIADINVFFQNRKNLYPKISQDAWYCSVQSEHLTEAAYAHLAESLHLDRVGGCEKRSDNIRIADKQVSDALCVISEDFFDFARCDLLEGENIWESGGAALTKSCMLEESFPAKYGVRAEVGDSLEVNGETYQIAGFFRSMELIGKVLVPLEGFQEKGFDQKNYYTLFVQDTASGGEALLQAKLQEHLYQVNYVDGIDRYYERTRKRCTANSLAIFLVTVPITLFSIVNCILIL